MKIQTIQLETRTEIRGTGPGEPQWCAYIGTIDGKNHASNAKVILHQCNAYDEHVQLLEHIQLVLSNVLDRGTLADRPITAKALRLLQAQLKAPILAHHESQE